MDLGSTKRNFQEKARGQREAISNSSWIQLIRDLQRISSKAAHFPKSTTWSTVEAVEVIKDWVLVEGCLHMEAGMGLQFQSQATEKWRESVINSSNNPLKSRRSTSQQASGRMYWWGSSPMKTRNRNCWWTKTFRALLLIQGSSLRGRTVHLTVMTWALNQSLEQALSLQPLRRMHLW